jgi:dTMP kinase
MDENPMFIVFEGIDGTGKSTQCQMLYEYLSQTNKVRLFREPTGYLTGQLIRKLISDGIDIEGKDENGLDLFESLIAYCCAADRLYDLYHKDGIIDSLNNGYIVILDRYIYSSMAYHNRGAKDYEFVRGLNRRFRTPDILFLLDNDISVSLERLKKRSNKIDVYETKERLIEIQNNYRLIMSDEDCIIIDSSQSKDAIFDFVLQVYNKMSYK